MSNPPLQQTDVNPPVSPLLRWVTTFESGVVLFSGFGLFLLSPIVMPLWPWTITPFNAGFLGAIYLTSWVAAGIVAGIPRWSPSRVVVPMILVFTAIVLLVSVLYVDRLTLSSPSTWLWFVLYIGIPLNSAYHVWLYRRLAPGDTRPLPAWYRNLVMVEVVVFTLYGIALFIAPATFSAFWPWKIDEFHGRMYCVAFLTPAIGAYLVSRSGSKIDLITMGLTQLAEGVFVIIGFVQIDILQKRADWSAAGTWVWIALFALLVVVGLVMIWQGQRRSDVHPV
jgi:hypothetical protein